MLSQLRISALLLFALMATGCAVAPLSNHTTARTIGDGNSSLDAGTTLGNKTQPWLPAIKYTLGIGENTELGAQYEVVSIGLWGKHAFINRQEKGFSLAAIGGTGLSGTGFYGYIGPIFSYRAKRLEPYFISRFNYVRYEGSRVDLASIGEISFTNGFYRYIQNTLGTMFWFVERVAISAEASHFSTIHSPYILKDRARWLFSGSFIFRF